MIRERSGCQGTAPMSSVLPSSARGDGSSRSSIQESFLLLIKVFQPWLVAGMKQPLEQGWLQHLGSKSMP